MGLPFFNKSKITIFGNKKPKIRQLAFSELRIKQKKSFFNRFSFFIEFISFLPIYIKKKYAKAQNLFYLSFSNTFRVWELIKNYVLIKLIWGRGKLGRPLIHLGTLFLAGIVFLTGSAFQENFIVLSNQEQNAFVTSTGDIVPQPIIVSVSKPSSVRNSVITYTVKPGDTLSSIGKKFGVTVDTIRYANNLTNIGYLKTGQKLEIPPVNGVVYKVKSGDTIARIAKKFKISEQAIADFNYLAKPFTLKEGQELILPDANIPSPIRTYVAIKSPTGVPSSIPPSGVYSGSAYTYIPYASKGKKGTGSFRWPTNSRVITQYFSWYHPAIDIAIYSPIYASDSGVVIRSGWWSGGYGLAIQIDHRNGYVTTYAHMSKLNVSVGQEVTKGQVIGLMGSTGRSTGTHVHFTIQYKGRFVNPLDFF